MPRFMLPDSPVS
jgi:hypothetical protein